MSVHKRTFPISADLEEPYTVDGQCPKRRALGRPFNGSVFTSDDSDKSVLPPDSWRNEVISQFGKENRSDSSSITATPTSITTPVGAELSSSSSNCEDYFIRSEACFGMVGFSADA